MPSSAIQTRPGVFTSEVLAPPAPNLSVSPSTAAFVCVGLPRGPLTPTLVTSYSQFVFLYGAPVPGTPLSSGELAVWQFFASIGASCYVVRTLASATPDVTTTRTLSRLTITSGSNVIVQDSTTLPPAGQAVSQADIGATISGTGIPAGTTITSVTAGGGVINVGISNAATATSGAAGSFTASVQETVLSTDATARLVLLDREATAQAVLTLKADNPGTWGNSLQVSISDYLPPSVAGPATRFTVRIAYTRNPSQPVVESFPDLSMNPADPRYVLNVLNDPQAGSQFLTAAVGPQFASAQASATAATLVPAVVTGAALTGGALDLSNVAPAGTVPSTAVLAAALASVQRGLQQLNDAPAPLLLNVVGATDAATVNAALAYAVGRKDTFVVIDAVADTPSAQFTAKNGYLGPDGTPSSYGAVYYPQVVYPDPNSRAGVQANVLLSPAPAVMARMGALDASIGVHQPPAGEDAVLPGATGLATVLSATDLDNCQAASVNALRNRPNGPVIYGVRTLVTSSRDDRYISVRRTLIGINASLTTTLARFLFKPNTRLLRSQVQRTCEDVLTRFAQQGALVGATSSDAFFVICDDTNNGTADINNGNLVVNVGVAPVKSTEAILLTITVYDGSVTVSQN